MTTKRRKIPKQIETNVLTMSARRCCLCYGLNADFGEKAGQIAHLDGDSSNCSQENLAWFCQPHHEQYDSKTSQCKGITASETKEYRTRLYQAVEQWRKGIVFPDWKVGLDVPLLGFDGKIPSSDSIPSPGIRLCDKRPDGVSTPSMLRISVHFKTSRYFGRNLAPNNERWLFLRADIHPAFTLIAQVCALNQRDVDELMGFLRDYQGKYSPKWLRGAEKGLLNQYLKERRQRGWALYGPMSDKMEIGTGDYFRIWRENGEVKLVVSTHTATNASISVNARLSDEAMKALADYLETTGFAKPPE